MSMGEAFAKAREHDRAVIMQDTWGHLAPIARETYKGYMIFVFGCYGDLVLLNAQFADLDDSPWFYEDANNFIGQQSDKHKRHGVYRFEGTYIKFKNGNCRFSGKVKRILPL